MKTLTELEQDALTEVFNIGVGLAADVLSQMVNETVRLSVPLVELTSQEVASVQFHDRENRPLCAIRQTYSGEVTTDAILMFPVENSLELVRSMVGSDIPLEQLTEMEQDAMAEIGNIILNAVISQLSSTLDLSFDGSLPEVSMVTGETIFADFGQFHAQGDGQASVLMLTIDFELSTRQVSGYLAFLLDIPSSEKLISRLDRFING
ncbi:MAG: chemotaxis protein CheC [Burkholderiales bacterium]|nr:chemotaxis protein CheC [Burkholderiales bacterium]